MKVMFFDPCAKSRYTALTARNYAMGGSEASLIRVAAGLAALGVDVSVFQLVDQSRNESIVEGVRHINARSRVQPDVIVHQRTASFVEELAQEYPNAKHIVWLHDNFSITDLLDEPLEKQRVVCVSDWHANAILAAQGGSIGRITRIYNPVVIDAERKPKIAGRLGFFSSAFKGLTQVKDMFRVARAESPWLELYVADPGYVVSPQSPEEPGIVNLGELSHPRVLEEMSRCEVLFYPQTCFPETFGLVLAEANAMGTPVLCHDMGAAKEVLNQQAGMGNEVIDCASAENIRVALKRLWRNQPTVVADPRFEPKTIVAEWKTLLEGE